MCACLFGPAGGGFTGAALNPARVIGPLAVFKCGANIAWIYILAQLLASVLACSIFAFVSGWGPLMPLTSYKELNISWPEALHMWITGESGEEVAASHKPAVHASEHQNAIYETQPSVFIT